MREVLFRAKGRDGEGWREGYYWRTQDTTYCFAEDYDRNPDNVKHYLLFDQMTDWGLPNLKLRMDILPETLCQSAGLIDRNGKHIWENDILMANGNPEDIYKVCFEEFGVMDMETETITDKAVGWYLKVIPTEDILSTLKPFNADMPLNNIWIENCSLEVVGNIFDNPELIKAGDTHD